MHGPPSEPQETFIHRILKTLLIFARKIGRLKTYLHKPVLNWLYIERAPCKKQTKKYSVSFKRFSHFSTKPHETILTPRWYIYIGTSISEVVLGCFPTIGLIVCKLELSKHVKYFSERTKNQHKSDEKLLITQTDESSRQIFQLRTSPTTGWVFAQYKTNNLLCVNFKSF